MSMSTNISWLNRLKKVEVADASYAPDLHPLVMEKAFGEYIFDAEGKKYLDFCCGFGALSFGHTPPFAQHLFKQYSDGSQDSPPPLLQGLGDLYASTDKVTLEENLLKALPPRFTRVSLAVTGAQAVETALKTALLYSGGTIFLAFRGAYHGVDFGALRVTESPFFKQGFEAWCQEPTTARSHWLSLNCPIEEVKKIIANSKKPGQKKLAGIIIEPIQGRAGIHFAESDWLKELAALAKENDLPLIFDEIYCGMGRTGCLTYSEKYDADIVCFGKALGAGMPISAVVGTEKLMAAWPENTGEARHTGTFFGHPLSVLFAINVLQRLGEPSILEGITDLGNYFNRELALIAKSTSSLATARGQGLMQGIDFGEPGKGVKAMDKLREKGIIGLAAGEHGECIMFTPSFTTSSEHIDLVINALKAFVAGI